MYSQYYPSGIFLIFLNVHGYSVFFIVPSFPVCLYLPREFSSFLLVSGNTLTQHSSFASCQVTFLPVSRLL